MLVAPETIEGPVAESQRLRSVDVLRGAVMVLMAIDHVRVYSGVPAGGTTYAVFLTRWVTHFCAPAFVFFAGTAAYFHGRKLGDTGALARYLFTRGLLLVVLELTLIKASWTFNLDYSQFLLAGVLWMLGWCMVLMAGLVFLSTRTIGIIGLALIFLQQLFFLFGRAVVPASLGPFYRFIYPGAPGDALKIGGMAEVTVLYVIVPWIGVMAAGYAFGAILSRAPAERDRVCLKIGGYATALFAVAAGLLVLLLPRDAEDARPALIRFLDQQKYPASQLFLLMTLGPTIALVPYAERARGWLADVMATFGRVPMFYYLLHIPLIHAVSLTVWRIRVPGFSADAFDRAPFVYMPDDRWNLPLLYLVFAICVSLLYFPCRWYADRKATRPAAWMRYL